MTRQISFDLESLSLEPNAMILAIGAVEFDVATGELGNTFYRTIDITAKGGGGVMDPATVKWWVNQSRAARERIFADPEAVPLAQALIDFSEWLGFDDSLPDGEYPDVKLWQRGDKDGQWLACAYDGLNLQLPYRYWQLNDQRTITNLFPQDFFDGAGVAHDALADATLQAKRLMQALRVVQPAVDAANARQKWLETPPSQDFEDERSQKAKDSLSMENQRIVPCNQPAHKRKVYRDGKAVYTTDCYVCGEPKGHGGMPCPTMAPKS